MNGMRPEQIAAVRFCMGTDRGLTKWHCRLHVMTAPFIDVDCPTRASTMFVILTLA
jgi:hypothetical protein